MIALVTTLALVSGAELKNEAWVVVSQRSSVAKGTALDVAKQLASALSEAGIPNPTAPDDLTSCAGKVPCLVSAARGKNVSILVTLEIGTALDDLIVRVAAVSVDENGRVVQRAEAETTRAGAAEVMRSKIASSLAPPVRTLLALPDPAAKNQPPPVVETPKVPEKQPEPPKVVEAKPPPPAPAKEPAPAPAATTTASSGGGSGKMIGIVIAGLGAVLLVSGVVASGLAAGMRGQRDMLCPVGMQCNNPMAYQVDASMRSAQLAGGALIGIGLAAAVAGVAAMFLLGGDSSPSSSAPAPEKKSDDDRVQLMPFVAPGQAGLSLGARF